MARASNLDVGFDGYFGCYNQIMAKCFAFVLTLGFMYPSSTFCKNCHGVLKISSISNNNKFGF
jgi:hypothetical protein